MKTRSSQGSIPAGLTLYTFEYPEAHLSTPWPVAPHQQFLNGDDQAAIFANQYGATSFTHVLSGRVIRAKSRE